MLAREPEEVCFHDPVRGDGRERTKKNVDAIFSPLPMVVVAALKGLRVDWDRSRGYPPPASFLDSVEPSAFNEAGTQIMDEGSTPELAQRCQAW